MKTFFVYKVFVCSFAPGKEVYCMEIRDKIIQGATEQFMLYGVRSVTMDDIAGAMGMSKRTIYEHFTNKKELLSAVVDHVHHQQESVK